MSESDDTDLLLLIPPDFFVIHSDSEDSAESYRNFKSDHRFNELISHVNDLEERINFIESRDSNHAESFSETYIDNHNVQSTDLALRFYSLESTGFRFECNNDYTTMNSIDPCLMSSSGSKVLYPHQNFFPVYDSKSECVGNYDSQSTNHAISMEHTSQLMTSSNTIDSNTHSSIISGMPVDELKSPYKLSNQSKPFNISFLNEIDEFLESKNKQVSKNSYYSIPFDVSEKGNGHRYKLQSAERNADDKDEYQYFKKHSTTVPRFFERKQFDVGLLDELTDVDLETKFKHQSSNLNFPINPCIADSDVQTSNDNYEQQLNILQKNRAKDLTKESSNGESVTSFLSSNSSKLIKDSVHTSSFAKIPKERDVKRDIDNRASGSQPNIQQSSFNTGSQSSCNVWDSESFRKQITTFSSGNEGIERETQKTLDQLENLISTSRNRSGDNITCDNPLYLPPYIEKLKSTESYLEGRDSNFAGSYNELSQSKNFVPFRDNLSGPQHIGDIISQDLASCANTDALSSSKSSDTRLKNCQISESRHDSNSKMTQTLRSTKKEIDDIVKPPSVVKENYDQQKESLIISDELFGAAKPHENESTKEHTHNQYVRNQISHKLGDGHGKTVRPAFMDDGYYSSTGSGSNAVNLLSLSDLWGKEVKAHKREAMTVEQKLEEEFCRRKHCESLIQRLQCFILELQQKLAVAMRVDQSKDLTIQQLQTAWKRLANHWQELEEQRHSLSVKLSEEKEKHQQNSIDMIQKVKQCELELSKALDLAKGYKEKSDMVEGKMKELEISYSHEKKKLHLCIEEEQKHVAEMQDNMVVVQNEIKEMEERLKAAEKSASDEKVSSEKLQEELKEMKHMLESVEADSGIVKEENASLRLRLKEERARNDVLDQQMKSLKSSLDESKKKEKLLQSELKDRVSILERTKTELRDYYQQQVEIVVQEKLIEFQTQLDAAEASLHQEMEQKEKLALETANKQIKHIVEKNLLEVKLLEEKHKEELHLCKLQVTQAVQQINQLQAQLQSYSNHKVEIVEKLHSVMETQWQEALRIISGSSPVQHFQEQQHVILEKEISDDVPGKDVKLPNDNCNTVPPLLVPHSSSSSTTDEVPFNKEDQLTFRANKEQQCNHKSDICSENADVVKKYIEILLNRAPGNPLDQEVFFDRNSTEEIPESEGRIFPNWGKFLSQQMAYENGKNFPHCSSETSKCSHDHNNKLNKSNKPPWK